MVYNAEKYRPDGRPRGGFRFSVQLNTGNKEVGRFQSVGGLSHEIEVVTQPEGGLNDRAHKLMGQGNYPNLVLKRGYFADAIIEDWHRAFMGQPPFRRVNLTVALLDDAGNETLAEWEIRDAWPVKWEGPSLEADQSQIATETVEIAHHGILRKK